MKTITKIKNFILELLKYGSLGALFAIAIIIQMYNCPNCGQLIALALVLVIFVIAYFFNTANKSNDLVPTQRIAFAYFCVCILSCVLSYACPVVFSEWWTEISSLADSISKVIMEGATIALAYTQISWTKITSTRFHKLIDEINKLHSQSASE